MSKKSTSVFLPALKWLSVAAMFMALITLPSIWERTASGFVITNQCGTEPVSAIWRMTSGFNHVLETVVFAVVIWELVAATAAGLLTLIALVVRNLSASEADKASRANARAEEATEKAEAREKRNKVRNIVARLQKIVPVTVPTKVTHASGRLAFVLDCLAYHVKELRQTWACSLAAVIVALTVFLLPKQCLDPKQVVMLVVTSAVYVTVVSVAVLNLVLWFLSTTRVRDASKRRAVITTTYDIRWHLFCHSFTSDKRDTVGEAVAKRILKIPGATKVDLVSGVLHVTFSKHHVPTKVKWDLRDFIYVDLTMGSLSSVFLHKYEDKRIVLACAQCSFNVDEAMEAIHDLQAAAVAEFLAKKTIGANDGCRWVGV